jgi:hypothetical protein
MAISTIGQNGLNAPLSLTTPNLGTPSALVLTNATGLPAVAMPTGSVIQVVNGILTTQATTSSTNSSSPPSTGLSVTITPQFSSSRILLWASATVGSSSYNLNNFVFCRNGTIIDGGTNQYGVYYIMASTMSNIFQIGVPWTNNYLDSPATTSATTYTVNFWTDTSANNISFNSRQGYNNAGLAHILAMEIR